MWTGIAGLYSALPFFCVVVTVVLFLRLGAAGAHTAFRRGFCEGGAPRQPSPHTWAMLGGRGMCGAGQDVEHRALSGTRAQVAFTADGAQFMLRGVHGPFVD